MVKSFMPLCMNKEEEKTIQLVHSDGSVQIFHKPLRAGQIVQEFPQHFVCHSQSLYIGKKTTPLSPNDQLDVGNKYFLMPERFYNSALSLQSLALSLQSPPSQSVSACLRRIERASALFNPFVIEKDARGGQRIRVSIEFITKLMEDGRRNDDGRGHAVDSASADNGSRLCNTPELQKEYEKLVASRGQRWRPKLESIKEKEEVVDCHKLINKIKKLRTERH